MGKYPRAKGTHDFYPDAEAWEEDSKRCNALEAMFRDLCGLYGYGEVRTPVFEATELFTRSIGEGTDIVSKEMYTFTTKGESSLTLRPEGTAPTLRAYLDSDLVAAAGIKKLYYITSVFRYERPQKGRYRQHEQLGVEALGSDDPALDAEVIQLALTYFRTIGIKNLTTKLNSVGSIESRAKYLPALKTYVEPFLDEFSAEGKGRFATNPLRLLDTKNERELDILSDAPKLSAYLLPDEQEHLDTLTGYLNDAGVTYTLDPTLVRGFDYYTKTAFEIQSPDLGAQNALGGGGRYNKLVEELGGPPTPGIGFGLGIERALIALQSIGADIPLPPGPTAQIVVLGDRAKPVAVKLLSQLRAAGIASNLEYGTKNIKNQMRAAERAGAKYAVIIGDNEVDAGEAQVKNLAEYKQEAVSINAVQEWITTR